MAAQGVADKPPRLRRQVRHELGRVRSGARKLAQALAELERIESTDSFGTYLIEEDQDIDEARGFDLDLLGWR